MMFSPLGICLKLIEDFKSILEEDSERDHRIRNALVWPRTYIVIT